MSDPNQVTTARGIAYAAPLVGTYFLYLPMWGILPGLYVKYFGLSLTAVAGAHILIRTLDGAVDLAVGWASDRHRWAGGSRKLWVVAGGIGAIVSCYFLFIPPQVATPSYYLSWSMVYFVSLTVSEIPHQAWGAEIVQDYQSRARIAGFRSVAVQLGGAAFYALPLLPLYATTQYTPQVMRDALYIGALMSGVGILLAVSVAPNGKAFEPDPSGQGAVQAILRNKPLHCMVMASAAGGLGFGMWIGLSFIYVDSYLKLGAYFPIMFLLSILWAALSTPFWLKFIRRTSKATAWATGLVVFLAYLFCMFFVQPGQLWAAACLIVFVSPLCMTSTNIAAMAVIGDIVDYGKLKFRKNYGATYFAFNVVLFKLSVGLGGGLSMGIAGLFGFSPSNTMHAATAIFGLKLAFIILPACFTLIGLFFVLRTPITKHRHAVIQRRLESRARMTASGRFGLLESSKLAHGIRPSETTP